MSSLVLSQLFLDKLILALSWTLFHSLWLGLILAACAGGIMLATRYSSANTRYKLLVSTLLVFALAVVVSFIFELNHSYKTNTNLDSLDNAVSYTLIPAVEVNQDETARSGYIEQFTGFLNSHSGYIVFIWVLFILLRSIQLGGGLYQLNKIKTQQLSPIDEFWESRLLVLINQLGIKKSIKVFQSGLAKVPAVIGHFKPIILFPVGLMNSLSVEEVEAILIHELAHIKRKDFLINMIQIVMEMLFFFNPSFLWVSSLIHTERENCCDDIALESASNKRSYINALVSFQEFQLGAPAGSIGFTNRKDQLLQRVKRILYNHNKTLNIMEKISLITGLIITALVAFSFSSKSALPPLQQITQSIFSCDTIIPTKVPEPPKAPKTEHIVQPAKEFTGTIITTVDDKHYRLEIDKDVVKSMTVNDEQVAADKIADYKSTTDKIIAESKASRRRTEEEMIASEMAMAASAKQIEEAQAQIDQAQEQMEKAQREIEIAQRRIEMDQHTRDVYRDAERGSAQEKEEARIELKRSLKDAKTSLDHYKKDLKIYSKRNLTEAELARAKKEIARAKIYYSQGEGENARREREYYRSRAQEDFQMAFVERDKDAREREKIFIERNLEHAKKQLERADKTLRNAYVLGELDGLTGQVHGNKFDVYTLNSSRSLSERIINDLQEEGILTDMSDVSIKLNNKSLVVNGKKQPKEVFEMFKEKYVRNKKWSFEYHNKQD